MRPTVSAWLGFSLAVDILFGIAGAEGTVQPGMSLALPLKANLDADPPVWFDDPCLGIFDQALQHITVDFGLHERLPGHLWSEYSERGYRSLEQLVQAVAAGDAPAGQAAVDALLSRIDDYVHRLDPAEVGLWTTRSFVTGAYLSAGKLLSVADKAGLRRSRTASPRSCAGSRSRRGTRSVRSPS